MTTAFATNTSLTTLNLYFNNIGVVDATAFATAFATKTTLLQLFKERIKAQLNPYLEHNKALFQHQFWTPLRHCTFSSTLDFPFPRLYHQRVLTCLLCTAVHHPVLPPFVWHYIFSFRRRRQTFKSRRLVARDRTKHYFCYVRPMPH
jgi:hypothetical protein